MFKLRKLYFTLLELLMVVAIIAILFTLLFPALRNAKANAVTVACANNIKHIGSAVLSYSCNSNGWCPMETLDDYGNGRSWMHRLIPEYLTPDNKSTNTTTGEETSAYLQCPVGWKIDEYWHTSYALNYTLSGWTLSPPWRRLTSVKSFSRTMLGMEAFGCWRRAAHPEEVLPEERRDHWDVRQRICRHPKLTSNVVYCDGSVNREKSLFLKTASANWWNASINTFWSPKK